MYAVVFFTKILDDKENQPNRVQWKTVQLQTTVIVTCSSGFWENKDHRLKWKDVECYENPADIRFTLHTTKGSPLGRTFHVKDKYFMDIINRYKATVAKS